MIARMHHVVLDCPDADLLAGFYSTLLGKPVVYRSPDWVVVADNDHSSGLAFQPVTGYRPPTWPEPERPQQFHLDLMVEDLDAADEWVRGLGARPLAEHVYADPAGHPFCLITRPPWAPALE